MTSETTVIETVDTNLSKPQPQIEPKQYSEFYREVHNESVKKSEIVNTEHQKAAEYYVEFIKELIRQKSNDGEFSFDYKIVQYDHKPYMSSLLEKQIFIVDTIDRIIDLLKKEGFGIYTTEYAGSFTNIHIRWESVPQDLVVDEMV